ncbi:MAG: hypothetical protein V2A54_11075 [Bacteroidota bacterium]
MKGKKSQYILLPLALILWGLIIYKVILYLNDPGDSPEPIAENNAPRNKSNLKDTFKLLGNYRDPFLGGTYVPVRNDNQNTNTSLKKGNKAPVTKTEPVTTAKWPEVVYGGMIENKNYKKAVVILRINGKERLMSKGDNYDGVSLLRISRDSVHVSFNNQKKIIVK